MVDIAHRRDFHPHRLSGGEQQRVAIARALIHSPGLLLADEPTGNLGSAQGERIIDLFRSLARSRGLAILMATHNEALVRHADAAYRLHDGVMTPL